MKRTLMSAVAVGLSTFFEATRSRILLVAVAFAVALVGMSVTAAAVSMGERARLIVDVGLAATSAMGSLMAIALMIASFGRELERHTAYPVLARPLPRWAFVLGKYVGVLATMVAVVCLMLMATALAVWMYGDQLPRAFGASVWLACAEMAVVTAVALLCSCFTTPVLAATYSVAIVIAGNFVADIATLADKLVSSAPVAAWLLRGAALVLPDLPALSLRVQAANDLPVPAAFVAPATLYALAYAGAVLALAMILFTRRRAI